MSENRADDGFVSDAEQAAANDPSIGSGTPETAPHEIPFDDDDDLDADDDESIDDDDDTPIDEDI